MPLHRLTGTGEIICSDCLHPSEEFRATLLDPAHFPGTFHRLRCGVCGAGAGDPPTDPIRSGRLTNLPEDDPDA